jgi:anthranilate/para-aminobenzoate synthase component II
LPDACGGVAGRLPCACGDGAGFDPRACTIDGMAMAIGDREAKQAGLQLHPESILTPLGNRMLANLLQTP